MCHRTGGGDKGDCWCRYNSCEFANLSLADITPLSILHQQHCCRLCVTELEEETKGIVGAVTTPVKRTAKQLMVVIVVGNKEDNTTIKEWGIGQQQGMEEQEKMKRTVAIIATPL